MDGDEIASIEDLELSPRRLDLHLSARILERNRVAVGLKVDQTVLVDLASLPNRQGIISPGQRPEPLLGQEIDGSFLVSAVKTNVGHTVQPVPSIGV